MQTKDRNRMHTTGTPARKRTSGGSGVSRGSDIQIQYTPAKPFNRNRFLLRLATVAAVVLAIVLGLSIFFKVRQVMVSGAEKYTPWEIKEASAIQEGDALLSLSEAKITARIRARLPYVGDVRVGIKLPNTVNIEITELDVVYAVEDVNSGWWLMDASGRIVDSTNAAAAKDHTRVLGVQIKNAKIGERAIAAEPEMDNTQTETIPVVATQPVMPARELLDVAVQILTALENNGVMGKVKTVSVSDTQALSLWYENRYQVSLGDGNRLDYKIGAMKAAIQKMGEYQSGYLDVSFTIWPDEVGYRPFDGS